jgi:hypothetical protein
MELVQIGLIKANESKTISEPIKESESRKEHKTDNIRNYNNAKRALEENANN